MEIEIVKIIVSSLTPITICIFGWLITKNIEKTKSGVLKEKEFQVRWAELFLDCALKINSNVSILVHTMFDIEKFCNNKQTNNDDKINELIETLNKSALNIVNLEWDIQNYVQFAPKNKKQFLLQLRILYDKFLEFTEDTSNGNLKGDMEEIRALQVNYNILMRKVHSEILSL